MSTKIITKDEADALIDASPEGRLLRYVDAKRPADYPDFVLITSAMYVDGGFSEAYEDYATKTGTRPVCSIVYTGEPRTESRRPLIRTTAEDVAAIVTICERAEVLTNA